MDLVFLAVLLAQLDLQHLFHRENLLGRVVPEAPRCLSILENQWDLADLFPR